jgi:hypothetical protein
LSCYPQMRLIADRPDFNQHDTSWIFWQCVHPRPNKQPKRSLSALISTLLNSCIVAPSQKLIHPTTKAAT